MSNRPRKKRERNPFSDTFEPDTAARLARDLLAIMKRQAETGRHFSEEQISLAVSVCQSLAQPDVCAECPICYGGKPPFPIDKKTIAPDKQEKTSI